MTNPKMSIVLSGVMRIASRIGGSGSFLPVSGISFAIKRPGFSMKNLILNVPTLLFVVGTRAALGVGIGMLLSSKLSEAHRRRVGLGLVAIGAATTIPAARAVRRGAQQIT